MSEQDFRRPSRSVLRERLLLEEGLDPKDPQVVVQKRSFRQRILDNLAIEFHDWRIGVLGALLGVIGGIGVVINLRVPIVSPEAIFTVAAFAAGGAYGWDLCVNYVSHIKEGTH